ncbi:unnamed protein product [Symbiodinium sp. CCMP2456]|nr:unnamed protein product [Symbiodinium sp. CCMP2456]
MTKSTSSSSTSFPAATSSSGSSSTSTARSWATWTSSSTSTSSSTVVVEDGASSASVQVATLLAVACGGSITLVAFFFACRTAHLKGEAVHAAQRAKFEEPIVTALQGPRTEESAAAGFADITKIKRKAKTKPAENDGEEETVDVVVEGHNNTAISDSTGRETVQTSALDVEVDPAAAVPQSTPRVTASLPEERQQGPAVVNESSKSLSSADVLHKKTKVKCKAKVKKKVKKPIDEISREGHLVIDVSDTMSSEMVEGAISLEEVAFEEPISFGAPGDLPWHSHVPGDRGHVSGTQAPEQKKMKKIPKCKEKTGLDASREPEDQTETY